MIMNLDGQHMENTDIFRLNGGYTALNMVRLLHSTILAPTNSKWKNSKESLRAVSTDTLLRRTTNFLMNVH